jgi:signal transduction histidine kinase
MKTACLLLVCWLFFLQHSSGQAHPPVRVFLNEVALPDSQTALSLTQSKRLTVRLAHARTDTATYECQLAGFDPRWLAYQRGISLAYPELPGGDYQLLVRRAGQVPRRVLQVRVEPQLWQRWWFLPSLFGFAFLMAGSGLYFNYLYRLHQQKQMQQARDRIARDLHDDMGSYLSSISILSRSAARAATRNPDRAQAQIEQIGQTARQMLETMGDIVWSINPTHDSMTHVINRMSDVGNALFANTDTDFSLQAADDVGTFPLTPEARRDFFLIYKESLTNAARYAQATRVRATLTCHHDDLLLTVQDNGCGFDPVRPVRQNPGGGNGLGNLRTRATQLGGELTIDSKLGEGTTVTLRVPNR